MKVKQVWVVFLCVILMCSFYSAACSGEYPTEPIQMITPHSPGGGVDLFSRLLCEELARTWKVPVNVLNKPGAGGAVAAGEVAHAKKNGHTMLGVLVGQLVAMNAADPKGPIIILRDFDPVYVNYGYAACVMVTRSESNLRSLDDVIDYARKNPGQLVAGTGMVGTGLYMDALLVNRLAKVNITILPTKGPGETNPMVLGGHVHLGIVSDVAALPYVTSGKMRVLATDIKSPIFPEVPSYIEKGLPLDLVSSFGVFGPKGSPPAIIKTWEDTIRAILKDPKFEASSRKIGFSIHQAIMGSNKLAEFLKKELEIYSRFTPEELGWKK